MMGLKNTNINETDRTLATRSVFVAQVMAVEGDPSWNIWKQKFFSQDEDTTLLERRLIDKGSGRIIIYLTEKDNLKVANPLLPRFYNIFPKPGEYVKVIAYDVVDNDLSLDYIGPIIPSLINTNNSDDSIGRRNQDIFGNFSEDEPVINFLNENNDVKQIYPSPQDIAIQGRGASQILIRKLNGDTQDPHEYIVIRSGMFTDITIDKVPIYNPQESFIKLTNEPDPKIGEKETSKTDKTTNFIDHIYRTKYDDAQDNTPPKTNEFKTRLDVVAQKINLFTYGGKKDIAYSIPYGELLFTYLSNLEKWLINHQHGIDGTPAQDPQLKLGNNLSIDDNGNISLPGNGTKVGLTPDIKII
jgi:hypothetical protein